jgi:hypothetical protein
MTATLRVPRTRGALSGLLLVLLGLWGALVPLVGPYFHFGFAPDSAWHFTSGRSWLQIVPGCAVLLGGLITLTSANRAFAAFGAWLAALGGAWFVVGVPISALWADQNRVRLGSPLGGTSRQVTEQLTLLYGLGVVIVFLAAVALGRLAVVGVRDAALAEEAQQAADADRADDADRTDDGPVTEENPVRRSTGGPGPRRRPAAPPHLARKGPGHADRTGGTAHDRPRGRQGRR